MISRFRRARLPIDAPHPSGHLQTVLPIAENCDGEFLVSPDGAPVWPLHGEHDSAALERLTTVFGGRLERVPAGRGIAQPLSKEDVVALGPDADSAAKLYAHLTRRRFRTALDLDALTRTKRPSVVVTTAEYMTAELLEWLYGRSGRSAPGIICGDRGAPLRRQVLLRAAAATLCGPLKVVRSDIFPTVPVAAIRQPGSEMLGSKAPASERRQALARGAGVLAIMTHSDGVDAFMGSDLTICPMVRTADDISLPDAPRCQLTGFCHRHGVSVSQAVGSDVVFRPEEIAARVFVWDVCFGVMPTESAVDPRWGIGGRLLDSAGIGAILTTWRIVLSSPEHTRCVSQAIASGVPAGVAVARFNASPFSLARHHRLCLFGDPRVRLPAARVQERAPTRPDRSRHPPAAEAEHLRQVALLRLCMIDAKLRTADGPRAAVASRALEAIDAFEAAASKDVPIAALNPQLGNDMRAGVLDYALSRGKLLESWIPFTRGFRETVPRPCPVCSRRADTLQADMRPPGVYARRLVLCPICGVLEDAPIASDIRMELAGRSVRLHGTLPRERWAAGVVISSSHPEDSVRLMWPAAGDGTLAPSAELPQRWPPGPLRISAVIVWDATFAVISRMARDPMACGAFTAEAAP
jgi:hypothetical protein